MRPGKGAGRWGTFYPFLRNIFPFKKPRGGGEEPGPPHHPRGTREPYCASAPGQFPSISVSYNRDLFSMSSPLVLATKQRHGRSCPWGRALHGAGGRERRTPTGRALSRAVPVLPSPRCLLLPTRSLRGFSSGEPQVCEPTHTSAYPLKLPIGGSV